VTCDNFYNFLHELREKFLKNNIKMIGIIRKNKTFISIELLQRFFNLDI